MLRLSNVFKVGRWEFLKNVRTPTFLVLTFVIPLVMLLVAGVTFYLQTDQTTETMTIGVVDHTPDFYFHLEEQADGTPVTLVREDEDIAKLKTQLTDGELQAYLVIDDAVLVGDRIPIYVEDPRNLNLGNLRSVLVPAVTAYRLEQLGLTSGEIQTAIAPVSPDVRQLDGASEPLGALLVPMIMAFILIFSAIFSGQILMYGVIKEKRSRVVEILLSSISASELLWGKVLGLGTLSLLQIAIWVGAGIGIATRFIDLPHLGLTAGSIMIYLLYFLFGFLLLAALFAAMGATMKDVEGGSQAQGLVVMVPLIPVFFSGLLIMQPNALWVRILSHVPPLNITTVLLRMGGTTLPAWEIASTLSVLLLSALGFLYLAARIFDGGLLAFDRDLGLRDLRKMLKRS